MWSAKGVASLKESLQQPGVKFQPATKQEVETKVYQCGQEIAEAGPQLPNLDNNSTTNNNTEFPDFGTDESAITTTTETTADNKTQKLVLDAGAFISGVNLSAFGPNCEYYTIDEVIAELKDERARHNFSTFPYPITVKVPSNPSLIYVNQMSMQTGDFHVLSLTDRKVLALCHQIEVESNGSKYIRSTVKKPDQFTEPALSSTSTTTATQITAPKPKPKKAKKATPTTATAGVPEDVSKIDIEPSGWASEYSVTPFNIDSFLSPQSTSTTLSLDSSASPYPCYPSPFESFVPQPVSTASSHKEQKEVKKQPKLKFTLPGFDDGEWLSPNSLGKLAASAKPASQLSNARDAVCTSLEGNHLLSMPVVGTEPQLSNNNINAPNQSQSATKSTDANDDSKPTSIAALFQQSQNQGLDFKFSSCVAGITTDYSMQNVMLQCGIKCLTVDGLAISTIRQYIMGCHACFTLSKDMSRGFCPSCGGFTMVRLVVSVDKKGNARYNWPMQRILNTRGTIFQISQKALLGHKGRGKIVLREDMMPRPKLKDVLIARGEREMDEKSSLFDDAALFGYVRQLQTKASTYGFGKRNMNVTRRRK